MAEKDSKDVKSAPAAASASAAAAAASVVDMRSDTVTKPTPAMRKAMAEAEVGDDVMGDDPTVIKLQNLAASMLGKEAGLFVASGTMGNLICCMAWCDTRDSEMIVGSEAHIHLFEQGSSATLGGIHSRVVYNKDDGTLDLKSIESLIRLNPDDPHLPITKLICLENTHNRCFGCPLSAEYTDSVGELAKKYKLKLHVDGARIFNAQVALGVPAKRLVQAADSVSICLSKGLASPVGSVIVGPKDFIARARRLRKALGGGMRQAGVLAACGILSLTDMVERLADDHKHAKALATGLASLHPGITVKPVHSNIVFFQVDAAKVGIDNDTLKAKLKDRGVLCGTYPNGVVRFCTHYHVTAADVATVLKEMAAVISAPAAKPAAAASSSSSSSAAVAVNGHSK